MVSDIFLIVLLLTLILNFKVFVTHMYVHNGCLVYRSTCYLRTIGYTLVNYGHCVAVKMWDLKVGLGLCSRSHHIIIPKEHKREVQKCEIRNQQMTSDIY